MRVDADCLKVWFSEFNAMYFGGCLPVPAISTGMSKTRLGSMSWRSGRRIFRRVTDYSIRISNYYDADEMTFKSVLLHEMIHLYIVSAGLRDTSAHGLIFREQMRRINSYGWKVSVTAKMQGVAVSRPARRRARVVLAAVTSGGKCIFSVVSPRYVVRIDRVMRDSRDVSSYSWHISTDDYFAAYPVVRTPKGRVVGADTYERLLAGMRPLSLPEAFSR